MFSLPQSFPLANGNFPLGPTAGFPASSTPSGTSATSSPFPTINTSFNAGQVTTGSSMFPPINTSFNTNPVAFPSTSLSTFNTASPTFGTTAAPSFSMVGTPATSFPQVQVTGLPPVAATSSPIVGPPQVNTGLVPAPQIGAISTATIPPPQVLANTGTPLMNPGVIPLPQASSSKPPALVPVPVSIVVPPAAVVKEATPIPAAAPSTIVPVVDQRQWLVNLQAFIYQLLSNNKVVPEKLLPRFIDATAMPFWITAYTDVSYSMDDNYEKMEYYGDSVLDMVFAKYLMRRFPGISEGQLTDLKSYYMSKIQQGDFAQQLGMPTHLRTGNNQRVHRNLHVDVFEATFGALTTVGDKITEGLGAVASYNLLKSLYDSMDIDPNHGGAPRTQVEQFFSRFDEEKPKPEEGPVGDGQYKSDIILHPKQLAFLDEYLRSNPTWQSLHVNLNQSLVIASRVANTQAEATSEAFATALTFFNRLGITTEWAKAAKRVYDKQLPGVKEYVAQALQKSGFKDLYFNIPRKWSTKTIAVIQLVGTSDDGRHQILGVMNASQSERNNKGFLHTKQKLIQDYVKGIVSQ